MSRKEIKYKLHNISMKILGDSIKGIFKENLISSMPSKDFRNCSP